MRSTIVIFVIVTIIQALGQAMADIYLPSFPAIALGFHSSLQNVEFTLTIYALGYGLSQLIYGPLSDGIGRKKPLLVGLSLCTVGSLICGCAPNIGVLLLGRLCQALGAGATLTIGGAILRDLFEGSTLAKYTSYSGIVFVIFLAMAPLLGGYIQVYSGWRATFALIGVLSLLAFVVMMIYVPETNLYVKPENLRYQKIKRNVKTLLSSPLFLGYTACSLLTYGAILAWVTGGPALLETVIGLTPVQYGWVYAITGCAFAVGAFVNSLLVPRFGINRMLQIGLMCMLFSGTLMLALKLMGYINTLVIAGPAILLSFSASLVFPNTSAGLFQPFPRIAGIASAIFYSTRLLGGAIFSAVIALLPHATQTPMALALMAGSMLSLIVFYFTLNANNKSGKRKPAGKPN